jgi:hypothetical protein
MNFAELYFGVMLVFVIGFYAGWILKDEYVKYKKEERKGCPERKQQ